MIAEAFLMCALALQPSASFSGNHELTKDDAHAFLALMEPARRIGRKRPAIVFVYNYFERANQLRTLGMRVYSITLGISGGHLKALLGELPFIQGSLGAIVLLQKVPYSDLFEAIETVDVNGVLIIKDSNLPYLGEVILLGMGFHKTYMTWRGHRIYRRNEMKSILFGKGFETFNAKKVLSPQGVRSYATQCAIRTAA